ncbi:MAG: bifunctional oligoribonuclease/PAP phosphatase NrnA [Thermodesulfobacteriota bacterium]|nr:bifunctional oligoribonuclease/PAP phosphatase NrnA [Thermodesulfobacteriota bacterium]
MKEIIETLNFSRRIFVATHVNPDGDAIGSLVAMGLALFAAGKKVVMYNESTIPTLYRFLSGVDRVTHDPEAIDGCDTAVIIDCGDLHRMGRMAVEMEDFPILINIDHHATNSGFGHYRLIDPKACASAEIVYRIIEELGVSITTSIATALYTGILTDTGSFRFANTSRETFALCEILVAAGANPSDVARHLYGQYSIGRLKLLNMALDSIEISRNGKLSLMALTQEMLAETGTVPEDIDGMINYARRIEDIDVAVLIRENRNGNHLAGNHRPFHVSLRSNGIVDVAAVATTYGGGGHPTAAGFQVEAATLNDLKDRIWALADTL